MIGDIEYCYFCGRTTGEKVDSSDYVWCGYCNTEGIDDIKIKIIDADKIKLDNIKDNNKK